MEVFKLNCQFWAHLLLHLYQWKIRSRKSCLSSASQLMNRGSSDWSELNNTSCLTTANLYISQNHFLNTLYILKMYIFMDQTLTQVNGSNPMGQTHWLHHRTTYGQPNNTSSACDQVLVTVKEEKWLQGYCSAQLLEPQEHAGLPRSLLWPAAWRPEVRIKPTLCYTAWNMSLKTALRPRRAQPEDLHTLAG